MSLIPQLYRLYVRGPEHPAKLRLERWLASKLFPAEGFVYDVDKHIKLYLHPNDWIEYLLLKYGKYEPHTLSFIEKNLLPGQIALLAGVNFGLHLILASQCVSKDGCVIGVEPQPKSIYRAHRNIMLNNLPQNIRLVSSALAHQGDLIPMDNAPTHNSGSASINTSTSQFPFYIYAESLDNLLIKLGMSEIDFMLLDVEGYELNVLRGISEKCRPSVLVVEVNPEILKPLDIDQAEIYATLKSMGYTCWSLDGKPAKPNDVLPEQNLIALLKDNMPPNWIQLQ